MSPTVNGTTALAPAAIVWFAIAVSAGGSLTGPTVSTNVSAMLTGVPPMVFVAVTVIVVMPDWLAAGVRVRVRVHAVSALTTAFAFGSSVVLLDVAAIESKAVGAIADAEREGQRRILGSRLVGDVLNRRVGLERPDVHRLHGAGIRRVADPREARAALIGDADSESVVTRVERRAAREERVRRRRTAVVRQRAQPRIDRAPGHADLVAVRAMRHARHPGVHADQVGRRR